MAFFLVLLIVYGLPISIIILGIRWVFRKEGKEQLAKNLTRYSFLVLLICLIGVSIAGYVNRRYVFEFNLKDKYAIELIAIQQEGFLDNPVDFYMEIEDLNSGREAEFEFFTGDASAFKFYLDPNATEFIYINGIDSNIGRSVIIDMSNSSIDNEYDYETYIFENMTLCAELSSDFELTIK
jgi:hypothetical protein